MIGSLIINELVAEIESIPGNLKAELKGNFNFVEYHKYNIVSLNFCLQKPLKDKI